MIPSKYQHAIFDYIRDSDGHLVVEACAGGAKCLGIDTPVLMYNGSIKHVQDVVAGDRLMGPDSTSRLVLSTNTGNGPLYRIHPMKGDSWVCNDVHVMTVYHEGPKHKRLEDIPLNEMAAFNRYPNGNMRQYRLQRIGVDFPAKPTPISPYLLGLWLGDGSKAGGSPILNLSEDKYEVIEYLKTCAFEGSVMMKVHPVERGCIKVALTCGNVGGGFGSNPLRNEFRRCINGDQVGVPREYMVNSRDVRLQVLAGLMDTDSHMHHNHFAIVTKYDRLKDDLLFLSRSLGFAAYASYLKGEIKSIGFVGYYWHISISGDVDQIPCKVSYKRGTPRRQIKSVLRTGFREEAIGNGDYYGFTLDGDGRFLLGDFTITHNTSSALESLRYVPPSKRILFLAYNKSIATTLQARVPATVKASTIHSQGFSIVKSIYPNAVMDSDKVYNATQAACRESRWIVPKDERMAFLGRVRKIVDLMRLTLTSERADVDEMCNTYDIENWDDESEYAMEVYTNVIRDNRTFDFTDMIFIPATHDFATKGYDMVYVDEFQDCCKAQYVFIRKLLRKPGGRMVMIGDRNQSIYGHQGSDPALFDAALLEPNTVSLPLSISYRCPAAVVRHAQHIVPGIEAREGAPEGKVVLQGSIKNVKDGDVVLCRTNFPLVQLCLHFLKAGRKAIVRGNDLGKSLLTFLKPYEGQDVDRMELGIEAKKGALVAKLLRKYPDRDITERQEYQTLTEKVQIINALAADCDTVEQVVAKVNRIFSDDMGTGIILSTVHRFKGLEAENVFIVEPQLIPFPYNVVQPWQVRQERNIDYVARTRAMVKLEYIRDWSAFKKGPPKPKTSGAPQAMGSKHVDVTNRDVAAELAVIRGETLDGALGLLPDPIYKGAD